ncbi:MAG: hypothetical protein QM607_08980 [Microbacterium sp.]
MDFDVTGFLSSIALVLVVGLLFGAGVPTLFALGVRSLARTPEGSESTEPTRSGRIGAIVCFSLCALVAVFGVVVIVFGKQIFG